MVLKKYKILIAVLMIFSIILPVILADFVINIETLKDHRVSVIVRDEGKLTSLESFHQNTGNGEISITSTVNKEYVDLLVTLKKDGATILNEKFPSMSTAKPIYITLIPGNVKATTGKEEPVVNITNTTNSTANNSTANTTTQAQETSQPNITAIPNSSTPSNNSADEKKDLNSTITGGVTDFLEKGKDLVFSKNTLYLIGTIIALVAVFMMITYARKKIKLKKQPYLNFKFNLKDVGSSQSTEKRIETAERKLKEAQEEISDLKGRERRIREVEERFKKDKEELRKLRIGF